MNFFLNKFSMNCKIPQIYLFRINESCYINVLKLLDK